jgi:hypothetical protein
LINARVRFQGKESRLVNRQRSSAADALAQLNVAPVDRCELPLALHVQAQTPCCQSALPRGNSAAPLTLSARLAQTDYGARACWQAASVARWQRWMHAWRGWFTHRYQAETPRRQLPNRWVSRRTTRAARWGVSAALVFGLLGAPLGMAAGSNWAFRVNADVSSDQRYPSVASDAQGNFVITWQSGDSFAFNTSIFAQRYSANGLPIGAAFRVDTIDDFTNGGARIAMNAAGDFVIAWSAYGHGTGPDFIDVYARRFSADGTPLSSAFRVNSYTNYIQRSVSVAIDAAGNFVITWQDESSTDIYAQRYAADGTRRGDEFRVNTSTNDEQNDSQVAMDAAGDFAITWASENQDGGFTGVYAQRYSADGTPQGSEFRVNTTTAYHQKHPVIAMDATGDFTVAWSNVSHLNAYPFYVYDVYLQRYTKAGVPQGGETLVNTTTIADEKTPAIAMNAAGDFVVTWQGPEGLDQFGVFGQRYAANGTPQGGEFHANTYKPDQQWNSTVAIDTDGDFVVAWEGLNQIDGQGYDIYARLYSPAAPPSNAAVLLTQPVTPILEGGPARAYGIALNNTPTAPVNVTLTPLDPALDLGAGAGIARTLSFAPNASALISQTVQVEATDDQIAQGQHQTAISITTTSADANYTSSAAPIVVNNLLVRGPVPVAIADNDIGYSVSANPPQIKKRNYSIPVFFLITRTGALDAASEVHYTLGGSAVLGTDYIITSDEKEPSGTLSFVSTLETKRISLGILGDLLEPDKTITLTLSDGTAAGGTTVLNPESATITMVNGETAKTFVPIVRR